MLGFAGQFAFWVTDLVFSNPNADVETSLRLVFDGSLDDSALATENAAASSRASAAIGGAICGGTEFMDFFGSRTVMLRVRAEFIVVTSFGALEDIPFDDETCRRQPTGPMPRNAILLELLHG